MQRIINDEWKKREIANARRREIKERRYFHILVQCSLYFASLSSLLITELHLSIFLFWNTHYVNAVTFYNIFPRAVSSLRVCVPGKFSNLISLKVKLPKEIFILHFQTIFPRRTISCWILPSLFSPCTFENI